VFTRLKSFTASAIHRVGIDGTGLERLTPVAPERLRPRLVADGQRITFDSGDVGRTGSRGNIYVMRADGMTEGAGRLPDTVQGILPA
jgi:hypothetical protein